MTWTLGVGCPQCGGREWNLIDPNARKRNRARRTDTRIGCRTCGWEGIVEVRLTQAKRVHQTTLPPTGYQRVNCWCEATSLLVTEDDLWDGRTASCGRDGCEPWAHLADTG